MSNERERVEQEFHAHHELISTLMQEVPAGFVAFDEEARITFANPAAAQLWRRPTEDVLGRSIWDVFPEIRESVRLSKTRPRLLNVTVLSTMRRSVAPSPKPPPIPPPPPSAVQKPQT